METTAQSLPGGPTAFASQFEEIDRVLFEYRYKKQNLSYQMSTGTGVKYAGRQGGFVKGSKLGHNNGHVHGMNAQGMMGGNYRQVNHAQPRYGYAQSMVHGMHSVQPAMQPVVNYTQQQMLMPSPDNFPIDQGLSSFKTDGFSLNLSSSISSGSSFSSSGDHVDHIPKSAGVGQMSSIWDNQKTGENDYNAKFGTQGMEYAYGNGNTGSFDTRGHGEKNNFGLLNIWGNDMSVWG